MDTIFVKFQDRYVLVSFALAHHFWLTGFELRCCGVAAAQHCTMASQVAQAPQVNVNGLGPVSVHVLHGTGAVAAKPLVLLVDDCRGLYYVTISHI